MSALVGKRIYGSVDIDVDQVISRWPDCSNGQPV